MRSLPLRKVLLFAGSAGGYGEEGFQEVARDSAPLLDAAQLLSRGVQEGMSRANGGDQLTPESSLACLSRLLGRRPDRRSSRHDARAACLLLPSTFARRSLPSINMRRVSDPKIACLHVYDPLHLCINVPSRHFVYLQKSGASSQPRTNGRRPLITPYSTSCLAAVSSVDPSSSLVDGSLC